VKNENLIKHMLATEAIQEKQMSPHSHYPAALRFGDNFLKVQIPRRYAPGIIRLTTQTSLCLFSSSLIIMRALARRFNPATCYSSAPAGGGKRRDSREVALFREPPAPVTSRPSATGGGSTENEDEWGLAGLLHDIDVELTHADLKVHSKPGAEMAKQLGEQPLPK
jgi:hypothetical protein